MSEPLIYHVLGSTKYADPDSHRLEKSVPDLCEPTLSCRDADVRRRRN